MDGYMYTYFKSNHNVDVIDLASISEELDWEYVEDQSIKCNEK